MKKSCINYKKCKCSLCKRKTYNNYNIKMFYNRLLLYDFFLFMFCKFISSLLYFILPNLPFIVFSITINITVYIIYFFFTQNIVIKSFSGSGYWY